MDDTNSLIEQRRAKLKALEAKNIFPFQNKFTPTEKCDDAREKYKRGEFNDTTEVSVAGRITAHREMGKSMFLDVRDQSGRLQIYAQKNHLEETAPGSWDIFTHLDLGDFIGARGKLFTTKTGEISIKLDSFVILAKALRPPPAKWHGLEDTEIRYRQRYLDLMGNPDVKEVFLKRSAIVHEIRAFFHSRGYVEVETPAMQAVPGGAAAQPFKTFHNALGCEFYLRIALELYHKRLLVGGIDKLFEIGKNFRNEGLSRRHNPEFTMLEAYQAFGDYATMMELVESLIKHVAQKVLGKLVINHQRRVEVEHALLAAEKASMSITAELMSRWKPDHAINLQNTNTDYFIKCQSALRDVPASTVAADACESFGTFVETMFAGAKDAPKEYVNSEETNMALKQQADEVLVELKRLSTPKTIDLTTWRRAKYNDLIKEKTGADWFTISAAERRQRAHDMGAEIGKEFEDFEVTNAVFSKFIEPTLINPTFVTHLPKELVPLAKLSPDDPTTVEVFECCINGQEISPGYTEQNDPIQQRATLEHQAGGEQQKLDEDFLVALEHGMPPAGGMGMGIDRLCMMLLGQENIRDVILFPQLKPK
jgi:lysyl-tRNA synthetase